MKITNLPKMAVLAALCAAGGIVHAQEATEAPETTEASEAQEALKGVEPVVPVGPPVVPVAPVGPPTVPVAPVEKIEGVETVTVNTDQGPVVVVSFPVSGNVNESAYNIDFSALDANGDGYIARTEAQAMAARSKAAGNLDQQFAAADVSGDGRLGFLEVIDWVY